MNVAGPVSLPSEGSGSPTPRPKLPSSQRAAFACGMTGVSLCFGIVGVTLVYLFLPPESAGLPELVTATTFLGVLNAVVLIAASGRLLDAITDPWVAGLTDRSTNPIGRRTPFMRKAAIPVVLSMTLMFFPPVGSVSGWNIVWLVATQTAFFVAVTFYYVPCYALLADLTSTPQERVDLSIWFGVGGAIGAILGGSTPLIASLLNDAGLSNLRSFQVAVAVLGAIAGVLLLIPAFIIDERRYSSGEPTSVSVREAVRAALAIRDFRAVVGAEMLFSAGFMILQSGSLYIVTVLLLEDEAVTTGLFVCIVIGLILSLPVVRWLTGRLSKGTLLTVAFVWLGVVLALIYVGGRLPLPGALQAYLIGAAASFPAATVTALIPAAVADVARYHSNQTGDSVEAIFVATFAFMQKVGRTLGILIFAMLATLGRDVGDDMGIRLAGVVAGLFSFGAAALMYSYRSEVIESGSQ